MRVITAETLSSARKRFQSRPCHVQMHASLPSASASTQKAGAASSETRVPPAAEHSLDARRGELRAAHRHRCGCGCAVGGVRPSAETRPWVRAAADRAGRRRAGRAGRVRRRSPAPPARTAGSARCRGHRWRSRCSAAGPGRSRCATSRAASASLSRCASATSCSVTSPVAADCTRSSTLVGLDLGDQVAVSIGARRGDGDRCRGRGRLQRRRSNLGVDRAQHQPPAERVDGGRDLRHGWRLTARLPPLPRGCAVRWRSGSPRTR